MGKVLLICKNRNCKYNGDEEVVQWTNEGVLIKGCNFVIKESDAKKPISIILSDSGCYYGKNK